METMKDAVKKVIAAITVGKVRRRLRPLAHARARARSLAGDARTSPSRRRT